MAKCRAVIIDVETTGLSARSGDRVCEIGLIVLEDRRIVEKYETLTTHADTFRPV